jgi:hypothetical protein
VAVDVEQALRTLAALTRENSSAIALYRADWATPENLEAMRFWAQGELNRIQTGFASTDEVIRTLSGILRDILGGLDEIEGAQGPAGPKGSQGEPGRVPRVFEQPTDPAAQAEPGDFWIKTGIV